MSMLTFLCENSQHLNQHTAPPILIQLQPDKLLKVYQKLLLTPHPTQPNRLSQVLLTMHQDITHLQWSKLRQMPNVSNFIAYGCGLCL